MIRLVYLDTHKIVSKDFENVGGAYEFAIKNVATANDRTYYENLAGKTFETAVEKAHAKNKLMLAILSNALENVVKVFEPRS